MPITRRRFLASIIAAVAMSPLVCQLAGKLDEKVPPPEVTKMESTWDGRLSKTFLREYGLPEDTLSQKQIRDRCS